VVVLDALTYAGSLDNLTCLVDAAERVHFVHGSVRSPQIVESVLAGCDAVVHLAAETHVPRSISDSSVFFETDVLGTQTMAALAVSRAPRLERFVHVSSSEVYGTALQDAMDEQHPLEPYTPYAAAKCAADRLIHAFVQTYDLPGVIVRPFNNYGPGQHLEKLLPRFITSALRGDPLTVHGDGIERVLDAPLETVRGNVFNVGTGIATDVITLAHEVVRQVGASPELIEHVADRPGQLQKHIADTTKTTTQLGFSAPTALADGLRATIDWYRDNRAWWERQLWMRSVPVVGADGTIRHW
jgi:dTDP-glucose 4,6-dehydratase